MKSTGLIVCAFVCLALASVASGVDIDHLLIRDMPRAKMVEKFGKLPGEKLTTDQLTEMATYQFTGDTLKMLAILVEWRDRLATYPRETFDSMLFSRDIWTTGSVADYFDESSYGQVAVTGDANDWYDAGKYINWGMDDFIALFAELDPIIDYSQYDGDGDGVVDAVCFLRSGNGQETSGDPNDIWSYAVSSYYGWGPYDGVMIKHWNTSPETRPLRDPDNPTEFLGVDPLNRIRVFAHELSHNLGLPDLYDYDDKLVTSTYYTPNDGNDHPMVDWCLMGYGGYGILSLGQDIPNHHSGWCKMKMGWVEPIVLEGEFEDVVLFNTETTNVNSLYMLPIDPSEGEYFLLEYRNRNSAGQFDKYDSDFCAYFWPDLAYGNDPLDRGLMITHVHDSLVPAFDEYRMNDGWPTYPHYTVAIEDAGYDPARDYTYNPEGRVTDSAQWWYPYETRKAAIFSDDVPGQSEFGPSTVPSSDGYNGPTDIYVRVDSIVGDRLYLYVNNPGGPISCCEVRGDVDHSGTFDALDIIYLVDYFWGGGDPPPCEEEADANGDEQVDTLDLLYLVAHMWESGPAPVPCP
ncbi:MAG: M6 family metalloprotease domain-containing protein [Candidatus Zixiibacteriota bacterium]|nr:MAG: M6 family metalloprotease domain-containing protein [candidate division Zixibacteria bacterium]